MKQSEIIRQRLINQKITGSDLQNPQQVVEWMIAMQAQEFAMAKWAIGLRLAGWNDRAVEKAFDEGSILRTHVMRPTWHFVTAPDIRWLLTLTAPHINAASAYYHRQSGLDKKIFARCNDTLAKALEGGNHLTRVELQAALKRAKITAAGIKLAYIMMVAELDGIICSGARKGKQFTYALLDERAATGKKMDRDEAVATLKKRFFASRGPATMQDLAYWSGLTIKEIKSGVSSLSSEFNREMLDGKEYFYLPGEPVIQKKPAATFLMPDYDEYGMSYKDRDLTYNKKNIFFRSKKSLPVFNHMIIVNGEYGGYWQRKTKGNKIIIKTEIHGKTSKAKQNAIAVAKKRYMKFFDIK